MKAIFTALPDIFAIKMLDSQPHLFLIERKATANGFCSGQSRQRPSMPLPEAPPPSAEAPQRAPAMGMADVATETEPIYFVDHCPLDEALIGDSGYGLDPREEEDVPMALALCQLRERLATWCVRLPNAARV